MTRHMCFRGGLLLMVGGSPFPPWPRGRVLPGLQEHREECDQAGQGCRRKSLRFQLEVRHVVLKGTNEEIGRALATIAKERFVKPVPSTDRLRTRAQRRYLERNYPILLDRMHGVAGSVRQASR